jgi:hypothetical protein
MKHILIILALSFVALAQQPTERNYSTPAQRLVGRWQSADFGFQGLECDYYGPVDANTKTGAFIRYRSQHRKDQPWQIFTFKYQIINEDPTGERVTVNLLFNDDKSRAESYYIEHDGSARATHKTLGGMEISLRSVYCIHGQQKSTLPPTLKRKPTMKPTALLLAFACAAFAQPPKHGAVLFHGSLAVGSINKEGGGNQFWCEAEMWNGGKKPESVTVTVRHRDGAKLVLRNSYTLAPHEKRSIRIDDETARIFTHHRAQP